MDDTSLEKSITSKYLSRVLKQHKKLPTDVSRYLIDQHASLNGGRAGALYHNRCPRCFTPEQQLSSQMATYSLLPCLRSKRPVRRLRAKGNSGQRKLTAREQQMIASHENFQNIFLKRCLVCSHQERTPCALPDSERLRKRRKIEDAHKDRLKDEPDVQLPKIVVPDMLSVKTVRKPRLEEVDCGLTISSSLKLQLEQYTQESSINSLSENTPNTKKKKKKKNKKRMQGDAEISPKVKIPSAAVATGKCDPSGPKQKSNVSGIVSDCRSSSKSFGTPKMSQHQLNTSNNVKAQAKSNNNKRLSSSATNALRNALKKSSVPKQSSLKSFLDTLF